MPTLQASSKFTYTVVLPTYRERPNLEKLVLPLIKALHKTHRLGEVIVVDDNSQDGTKELLKKVAQNHPVRLISRIDRRGLASAIVEGSKAARYAHIIRMDADLAHRVDDLLTLLDVYEQQNQPTVIIGSRFLQGSTYQGKPMVNKIFSFIGRSISQLLLRLPIQDTSNNFRIFPKKAWLQFADQLVTDGNVMLIQELMLFKKSGLRCVEYPITYVERQLGESKLNIQKESWRFIQTLPQLWKYVS